ncbi:MULTISPECIES: hypothetical protein [Paraburkholderia]|uniref:Uncharacterized protein n=1 Tax=Paraburkholderia podalyriae TaxID=1938811 RepID=A0ABR7PXU5_9BURK|nr:hypothetical protein [Paraburkholderia podalyriae]MBC8751105.1 hypothetical protein [Paraburkholderia podalyriae]
MNWRLFPILAVAGLAACSSEARIAALRDSEIQLQQARTQAWVNCSAGADCDRLWTLTKKYVAQRSVTPIRRADDTAIETTEPHMFGAVYVWATRTTDDAGASTIRLKGMCRGMYRADGNPGWLYTSCAQQIRAVERDFRVFVGAAS